ncbi:2Fe-2S iron-sulfur cluster-binding protein [Streptomyces sp. NPDC005799]|uniref:2Fe-2S iron-sulfur cluster-binding protein n=1 Tax=Streptomyces sp. NPDC005799 TaxID=3154678 RepID=UPI0033F9FFE0
MPQPDGRPVTVTVEPKNVVIEVPSGLSVFEAALQQGVRWPTTCEGMGTCHLCFMSVVEGADHLDPPGPLEAEGLTTIVDTVNRGPLRLACQVRPDKDLVVFKRGVRRAA